MRKFPQPLLHSAMVAVVLCCIFTAACPLRSLAANVDNGSGAKLLQQRLPAGTTVAQASWEQLTRAVGLATTAHRDEAAAILTAALTRGSHRDDRRMLEAKLPCEWVARLLHTAVAAAPEKAADLLEVASSLCPDCAESLQSAVELFDNKNVADDKNVVDDKNGPANGDRKPADSAVASTDPSDPNAINLDDPEVRGLGTGGFGPGFPGAPGYVGSAPGGGIALPPPANPPVTAVMNG